eukprot:scaffold4622_cov95-Amphora_coffeaeformis.AAC.1
MRQKGRRLFVIHCSFRPALYGMVLQKAEVTMTAGAASVSHPSSTRWSNNNNIKNVAFNIESRAKGQEEMLKCYAGLVFRDKKY